MDIQLLLSPFDTALRGWRMGAGPEHLVDAGLVPYLVARGHAVETCVVAPDAGLVPAEIRTAFEIMRHVAERVRLAIAGSRFPLVLSGNCSTASGTLAALTPLSRGVFWFDAHADCNTPETSTSGFLDGMGLAVAMGLCWRQMAAAIPGFAPVPADSVLLLGARDLDPPEAQLASASALTVLSPAELRTSRLDRELTRLQSNIDAAYVHCDLDVLDPTEGQANPFSVPHGLTVAEVERTVRAIGRAVPLKAAAVTAYAPEYDVDGRISQAAFASSRRSLALRAAPIETLDVEDLVLPAHPDGTSRLHRRADAFARRVGSGRSGDGSSPAYGVRQPAGHSASGASTAGVHGAPSVHRWRSA